MRSMIEWTTMSTVRGATARRGRSAGQGRIGGCELLDAHDAALIGKRNCSLSPSGISQFQNPSLPLAGIGSGSGDMDVIVQANRLGAWSPNARCRSSGRCSVEFVERAWTRTPTATTAPTSTSTNTLTLSVGWNLIGYRVTPSDQDLADGFQLTGRFLLRHVLEPRGQGHSDARDGFINAVTKHRAKAAIL